MADELKVDDYFDATSSDVLKDSHTLFIDTNLETRLAMIVSDADTVSNLKKKITNEHSKCFSELGKIKINALKVKRKGFFYHLSDSMLVKNAFEGTKKGWFLSVDVSTIMQPNKNQMPNKPAASNQLALMFIAKTTSGDSSNHLANISPDKLFNNCGPGNSCNQVQKYLEMDVKNVTADHCSRVFSYFNGGLDYTSTRERPSDIHIVSETNAKHKGGESQVGVSDDHCNNPLEGSFRNELGVSEKRKSKKKDKTEVSNFTLKNDAGDIDEHSSGKTCPVIPKNTELENVNACNRVSEATANHKNDDSQVRVDHQGTNPLRGSLRSRSGANKKHKSKKKTGNLVSNCTVKDDGIGIDKHSSDKTVREVPVDVEMVNTVAGKGPCSSFLDDTDLGFLKTPVQTRDDESKNLMCDAQGNAPPEDASNSISATRKRKRSKSKQADNPQVEENSEILINNDLVPVSSDIAQQKHTTASAENLITETPEVIDLGADAVSQKNRKKRKRSSRDQEVFVAPPSSLNAGEERSKEDVEAVAMNVDKAIAENIANDIDKASESAFVSESNVQLARPFSAVGVDIVGHDVANAEVKSDVPDIGPESGLRGTKKSKKRRSTNLTEPLSPGVTELVNMKEDVLISMGEDVVREDDGIKINGLDEVKEQRESPYNRGTGEMDLEKCEEAIQGGVDGQPKIAVEPANVAETNINFEAGKAAGSKRLKKKAKKPKAVVSSAEYSNNSANKLSATAPHDLNVEAVRMGRPLSQTKISKPTSLDTSLIEDNGGGNNRLSKGEEESRESEEFVQKNYEKETKANSIVQEKETKMDFPREKKPPKSTISAAKQRKSTSEREKESQENEVIVQKNYGKETEIDSHIKEKENKMDFAQQKIADIPPMETGISAVKPRKKMKKDQSSTGETHSASPIKEKKLGTEDLISSNDGNREAESASKPEKLGKSSSKEQSTGKNLEPRKNIADGHGSLTSADLTQAPSSDTRKGDFINRPTEHVDGGVLDNPNVSDTNCQVDVSKSKKDGINCKEYFSPLDSNRETPPVETVVNVVQKFKSFEMAVKSKKSIQVSLESGSETNSYPKNSTDVERKDAKKSAIKAKKEIERRVNLGNNHSTIAKSSSKRMGQVVNSSQREKSLLATPASIFSGHSSESSEVSDTSTKAPSDNSSSSSDSDEERADSAGGADLERSRKDPKTPHSQRMDMDMILRRSSRFKMAKLSAVQSQLKDMEIQPIDFVPDSQPNQ